MRKSVTACDRCGDFLEGGRKPTTIEWADQKPDAHLCDGCRDALAARMAAPFPGVAATAARDRYLNGINAGRRASVKVKR